MAHFPKRRSGSLCGHTITRCAHGCGTWTPAWVQQSPRSNATRFEAWRRAHLTSQLFPATCGNGAHAPETDGEARKSCKRLGVEDFSRELVSCPRNTRYFAGGQLAVFQGGPSRTGGQAPISESYGSSEQRGKTANRPRPGGLHSKWVGCFVARQSRIDLDMLLWRQSGSQTTHFERNETQGI